ncbi:hypothetical protein [Chitinimonas sp. BJB300]|uniref:hypothetical protein n=1 Tax=Chitinimonas sp. BJB300 TaxID=1559339 RepID=UPI000C123584|nr:hypothetical protein [Chitinimonas sp. BJB300]
MHCVTSVFKVEEEAGTRAARLSMLGRGRVDAVLMASLSETVTEFETMLNSRYSDLGQWAVLPQPLSIDWTHIGVARKFPLKQYLPALNRAITKLSQRGAIRAVFSSDN